LGLFSPMDSYFHTYSMIVFVKLRIFIPVPSHSHKNTPELSHSHDREKKVLSLLKWVCVYVLSLSPMCCTTARVSLSGATEPEWLPACWEPLAPHGNAYSYRWNKDEVWLPARTIKSFMDVLMAHRHGGIYPGTVEREREREEETERRNESWCEKDFIMKLWQIELYSPLPQYR